MVESASSAALPKFWLRLDLPPDRVLTEAEVCVCMGYSRLCGKESCTCIYRMHIHQSSGEYMLCLDAAISFNSQDNTLVGCKAMKNVLEGVSEQVNGKQRSFMIPCNSLGQSREGSPAQVTHPAGRPGEQAEVG